jgi:ATP adenylyltransferase
MDRLYAPWREGYATRVDAEKKEHISHDACVFCLQLEEGTDEKYFILRRFPNTIVMLNLYPYNGGHLLVLPFKHTDSLSQLSPDIRAEIMEVTNQSIIILSEVLEAQGFNVGLNLARAAGAGIPSHVHFHVVPRWIGDTNFLVTLANTKQISVDLYALYTKLRPYFQELKI